jgi:hypothetical protein
MRPLYFGEDMKTYFLIIKAIPNPTSTLYGKAKGISAHFWVLDKTEESALRRAKYYLSEHGYSPESVEQEPVETTEGQYADPEREIGLAHFLKAQKWGIAAVFLGWEKDQ